METSHCFYLDFRKNCNDKKEVRVVSQWFPYEFYVLTLNSDLYPKKEEAKFCKKIRTYLNESLIKHGKIIFLSIQFSQPIL